MAPRPTEIVVSGPDPRGVWYWRHHDGAEGYHEVPADLADPEWTTGTVVTARVDHRPGGPVIVDMGDPATGPSGGRSGDRSADEPILLVNGEPFEIPTGHDLERGVVITTLVPFSNRAGARDEGSDAKRRPAVVVDVGPHTMSVRAVFSQNTEGRGQRLNDWQEAGLHHGSVIALDETIVSLGDAGEIIGRLSPADRRRLGL